MRTIPEVRERLVQIVKELFTINVADCHVIAYEISELIQDMHRRKAVRKAPVASRPMTPALRAAIRLYAARHPRATQHAIANVFRVNSGRVSESLRGKRQHARTREGQHDDH